MKIYIGKDGRHYSVRRADGGYDLYGVYVVYPLESFGLVSGSKLSDKEMAEEYLDVYAKRHGLRLMGEHEC